MVVVGYSVGFRFHAGPAAALAALALPLAVGYLLSWISALIGLTVRDPQTAGTASLLPVIPLAFTSSIFVPVATMPGWLQAWANNNPITHAVDATRTLALGGPTSGPLLKAIAWILGILAVVIPWPSIATAASPTSTVELDPPPQAKVAAGQAGPFHPRTLDGSGYPDGLAEEHIPLGARVIAVSDAFTSMISPRPYAPQLTVCEAVAELRQCTGTQFDPAVVDAFSELVVELIWPPDRSDVNVGNVHPVRDHA